MNKLPPLSKEFLRKLRLYLSSVSGSRAQYCYFNFFDGVVLSNSCSNGSMENHGDRLMDFTVGELGLHFVKFKDEDFFKEFKQIFHIPEREFFCVKLSSLFSTLTNNDSENLEIIQNDDFLVLKPIDSISFTEKNEFGFFINNFHVIRVIQKWYEYVRHVCSTKKLVKMKVDVLTPMENGVYFTNLDVSGLGLDEYYHNVQPTIKFLSFDGLTTVSIKSFIKKLKTRYTLNRYLWVDHGLIYSLAIFDDDVSRIISIRPNIGSLPLIDSVKFDMSKG